MERKIGKVKMSKIKPILQQGDSDCGCACIATILNYYGKSVSLRKIYEVGAGGILAG